MPRSSLPKPTPSLATAPLAWFRLKRMFGLASDAGNAQASGWTGKGAAAGPMPKVTDYALQHVIARNDRATIYRATERGTGRLVALKTVRIGSTSGTDRGLWRERFLREASAVARLKHDYIVSVFAGGVQGEGDATTGWLAGEMMLTDPALHRWFGEIGESAVRIGGVAGAVLVVVVGKLLQRRSKTRV